MAFSPEATENFAETLYKGLGSMGAPGRGLRRIGQNYKSGRGFIDNMSRGKVRQVPNRSSWWNEGEGSQAFTGIQNPAAGANAGIYGYHFRKTPRYRVHARWVPGQPESTSAPDRGPLPYMRPLEAGPQPRAALESKQLALGPGKPMFAHDVDAPRKFRQGPGDAPAFARALTPEEHERYSGDAWYRGLYGQGPGTSRVQRRQAPGQGSLF